MSKNLELLCADIASRIPAMQRDSSINNAEILKRLIGDHIKARAYKGRWVSVFVGWPTELLGPCHVDASSREENFSVVCYDGDTAEHGFLVFQESKIAEVSKMWLMGESPESIHEKVISQ